MTRYRLPVTSQGNALGGQAEAAVLPQSTMEGLGQALGQVHRAGPRAGAQGRAKGRSQGRP